MNDVMKPLLETLLRDRLVRVDVDTQVQGVSLPQHLMLQPSVALHLSRKFEAARMKLTEEGLSAQLSFGGTRQPCFVPWAAIHGVSDAAVGLVLPEAFGILH